MKYFPYSKIREIQNELIQEVENCLANKKNLIVHAPTGLGKTVATLAPALETAIEKDLTVFFVTSRNTQHKIAIETLREIKKRFNLDFIAVNIVGKKWVCAVPGIRKLLVSEFNEYCKKEVEDLKCEFYNNTKQNNKLSVNAKIIFEELKERGVDHSEIVRKRCLDEKLCPYEIATALARKARVIVADYYYLFHPQIKNIFLKKTGKQLDKSIIIIDEAHNLGDRVRKLQTQKISDVLLINAIKEAEKYGYNEIIDDLKSIHNIITKYNENLKESGMLKESEVLIEKNDFLEKVKRIRDYDLLIADLKLKGDLIREDKKRSYVGSVADFLSEWKGPDEGFSRIFSRSEKKSKKILTLSYRCLDPSLIIKPIIDESYCTIAMSGTLTPTYMYRDLYGFDLENTIEKEFESPFPKKNKLNLIITEATTKFKKRNEDEFKKIAKICAEITNIVPGNSAIYFPSYELRDKIFNQYYKLGNKTIFKEDPDSTKEEKMQLLEKFKSYKNQGAVLLAVVGGSFSEGIDLPGDLLKCVIIAGLPLQKPNLEIEQLIKYYDRKFKGKGWDYGYVFPAFNKAFQAAGRCIRSETDRGVIIFLDERYTWKNYRNCFPKKDFPSVIKDYKSKVKEFYFNYG